MRMTPRWAAAAGLTLLLAASATAQTGPDADRGLQQPPKLEAEARRQMREDYYLLKRQHPDAPDLNIAAARHEAYEYTKNLETGPQRSLTGFWHNIGPAPTTDGQTPTSDPRFPSDVSGRATAIAIDATNSIVYIGAAQGGVWRTLDNGATWESITDHLASLAIGSIAIDPSDPSTLYVGTGEGNNSCDSYGGIGIYKSTDGGATWAGPFGSAQFANRGVTSIAVDRNDPDVVLATSASGAFGSACVLGPTLPDRGVFRSTDGGMTWTKRTDANNRASRVIQDPVIATTWWAALWTTGNGGAHDGGLGRSLDNGLTWTNIAGTGGLPSAAATGRTWITAAPVSGVGPATTTLYFGTSESAGGNSGKVYKSIDSGVTWANLAAADGYCQGQCAYDMPIHVEPEDPDVLYTGGAGASTLGSLPSSFMRTLNGGVSFTDQVRSADMTTAMHADIHAITTWPGDPARVWVANDGGIWRSEDRGTNWINVNDGLATLQFTGGDVHPTLDRAYGGTQDNGTMGWMGDSLVDPEKWPHLDFGDGGFGVIDQDTPDNLAHTYFNLSNLLIGFGWTDDGFNTTQGDYCFSSAPGNGISLSDRVLFYAPIHLDENNSDTFYFGTQRLNRSVDFFAGVSGPPACSGAGTFTAVAGGQDLAPGGAISAIETVAGSPNLIYTGSSTGVVFRSTNGGTSFTQVDVGGSSLFVSDVVVDPGNTQIVYQSRSGFSGSPGQNVRKSTNGGASWTAAGAGLPDVPVNALELDPTDSTRVWAGTDVGIYVSTDSGASWTPYNYGFPSVAVFDLQASATTGMLVAFTHGRSAFALDLGDVLLFGDGFESGDTSEWSNTVP